MNDLRYSEIRGFNYQPSYGSTGYEIWQNFNIDTIKTELGRGKIYFPQFSSMRFWLSWDSFVRNPKRFADNFEAVLSIAEKLDIVVMPVLFNRWHDMILDYGGIYIDHFLPQTGPCSREDLFDEYLKVIVGNHASDPRIFAWDLCNEPFSYDLNAQPAIVAAEFKWLKRMYDICKELNVQSPLTTGPIPSMDHLRIVEPISDILTIHPYWTADHPVHKKEYFERWLDDTVEYAESQNKPLLATETCWGAKDDVERVEIIRYTLGELKKRNIGWLAYLLNHSMIADAHREEFGPMGCPGNLLFIEQDGTLRPGHEIFNEF